MSEVLYTYTTIGGRTESVDEAIVYVAAQAEEPAASGSRSSRPTCAPSSFGSAA